MRSPKPALYYLLIGIQHIGHCLSYLTYLNFATKNIQTSAESTSFTNYFFLILQILSFNKVFVRQNYIRTFNFCHVDIFTSSGCLSRY